MSLEDTLSDTILALRENTEVLNKLYALKVVDAEKRAHPLAAVNPTLDVPVVAPAGGPPNNMLAETLAAARGQAAATSSLAGVNYAEVEARMAAAQVAAPATTAPPAAVSTAAEPSEVSFSDIEALAMSLAKNPATRPAVIGMVKTLGVASVRAIKDKPEIWGSALAILNAAKGAA